MVALRTVALRTEALHEDLCTEALHEALRTVALRTEALHEALYRGSTQSFIQSSSLTFLTPQTPASWELNNMFVMVTYSIL